MESPLSEQLTTVYDDASPVQQFFLTWRATMGALVRIDENIFDIPDDTQKRFDHSFDIFQKGKQRLLDGIGVRTLYTNLRTPGFTPAPDERLVDILRISARQKLLTTLGSSNPNALPAEERRLARYLQHMISSYPRSDDAYSLLSIKRNENLNCLGASTLGSALLAELNIKHLQASVYRHALLLLVTSDRELYWWDMLNPQHNCQITDNDLESDCSLQTLLDLSDSPDPQGFTVKLHTESFRKRNRPWGTSDPMYMHVAHPDYGQHRMLLTSTGYTLQSQSPNVALEAFNIATHNQPMDAYAYYGKGCILATINRHEEALDTYEEALQIEPENKLFQNACFQEGVRVYGG